MTFNYVFMWLPGIWRTVNSSSSAGDCKIFWLRAYKSPVIADHPRARYSPDTEIVAMATLTAGHRQARYNTKEVESGSGWVDNPFDNKKRKHAKALWRLCLLQSGIKAEPSGICIFRCLPHPDDVITMLKLFKGMRKLGQLILAW